VIAVPGLIPALVLGGAAAAQPPVRARVLVHGSGDPVEGAALRCGGAEVHTDPAGEAALPPCDGPVEVRAVGYITQELSVDPGRGGVWRVHLKPEPTIAEVVVEARAESPHPSRQVLDRERVEKVPGAFEDPFRLAQSLPGVASTPEYSPSAGAFVLRGAAPGESRVFFDGVELPYLYHFQQYASVVHSRLLDELAVYPSSTGPAWGDAVGGVAAIRSRRADPLRAHAGVNVNAITGAGYVLTPIGEHLSLSASARRSFADLLDDANDQYTVWPAFWDYLTRVDRRVSGGSYGLTLIGAGDRYGRYVGDTGLMDPLAQAAAPDLRFERAFHGAMLHADLVRGSARHESVVALVVDRWAADVGAEGQLRQTLAPQLRHQTTARLGDRLTLAGGGDLRAPRVQREVDARRGWPELQAEAPLLAQGAPLDDTLSRVTGGVWAEPRLRLGPALLRGGLRVQADSLVQAAALEPRLSAEVEATPDLRLRAAFGRTTQAPEADSVARAADPLRLIDAWQGLAAVDWAVAGRWELGAEAWARRVDGAVLDLPGAPVAQVDGEAYGVELTTRSRIRERFFAYASLALARSFRADAPGPFDQPVIANAVVSWDPTDAWNLGLRWRLASGLPYTPLSGEYEGNTDTWSPVQGDAYSARLPTYQKLDLHVERAWAFPSWTLTGYLEAWWVPARGNAMYVVHAYDYSQSATVAGPPILPLMGLRADL
jgi:hypothetical protein